MSKNIDSYQDAIEDPCGHFERTGKDWRDEAAKPPHELLQFFAFAHLPSHLQVVSKPFSDVAVTIDACPGWTCEPHVGDAVAGLMEKVQDLPENCERGEALRKLRAIRSFVAGYGTAAGGMATPGALRMLLEAKDCAVRAVLFKR